MKGRKCADVRKSKVSYCNSAQLEVVQHCRVSPITTCFTCSVDSNNHREEQMLSCYYRRHYRTYRSVVIHMTEPVNINS